MLESLNIIIILDYAKLLLQVLNITKYIINRWDPYLFHSYLLKCLLLVCCYITIILSYY